MDVYATMNTADARCLTSFTLSQLLIPRWLYLSTRVVRYVHEFEFDIDARYREASAILFNRFCLVNQRYIVIHTIKNIETKVDHVTLRVPRTRPKLLSN